MLGCWRFQRGAHQDLFAWQKGSRLGSRLTLELLGLLLLVGSPGLPVSAHGTLLVGPEGISWKAALVLLLLLLLLRFL